MGITETAETKSSEHSSQAEISKEEQHPRKKQGKIDWDNLPSLPTYYFPKDR